MPLKHYLTIDGKTKTRTFARRDQFAPELLYFSDSILKNIEPEPSGEKGLADVRVVRALYRGQDRPAGKDPIRVDQEAPDPEAGKASPSSNQTQADSCRKRICLK